MNRTVCALFCLLPILMAVNCSGQSDVATKSTAQVERRVYGTDEKRIARLLSIGETGAKVNASPQDQALLCDIALQSISDRLKQSGTLSAMQVRAFTQMQTLYRQRAAAGRSAAQTTTARHDLEAAHPDMAERTRLAIGCIRAFNT